MGTRQCSVQDLQTSTGSSLLPCHGNAIHKHFNLYFYLIKVLRNFCLATNFLILKLGTKYTPIAEKVSLMASLIAQMVKYLPAMRETWVRSLGWEDSLEKEMATHSSTLAWKIPWTEETCKLQFMGSQRVGNDSNFTSTMYQGLCWGGGKGGKCIRYGDYIQKDHIFTWEMLN